MSGDFLVAKAHPKPSAPKLIDWKNRAYSLTCDDVVDKPVRVTLRNGKGVAKGSILGGGYDRWEVEVQRTAQGRLSRLGNVTAVLFYCSPQPSNFFMQELRVYRTDDGSEIGRTPTFDVQELAPQYQPKSLTIKDRLLAADLRFYGPQDSHADGPSILRHVTWTWEDGRFVPHGADGESEDRGRVDLNRQHMTVNGMGPLELGMSRDEAAKAIGAPIPGREGRRICTDFSVEGGPEGLLLRFESDRLVAIYVHRPATTISTLSGIHIDSTRDDVLNTYPGEITSTIPEYGGEELIFAPAAPEFAGKVIRFGMNNGVVDTFIAGESDWAVFAPSCGGPE
ncbi:hypothetical protein [Streptomyces vastus]|uniref:Uncharacterized protein n=1 Tax=Streptomyces vastus TaxID=285451 RepID=A0ABN3RNA4_9ACTN